MKRRLTLREARHRKGMTQEELEARSLVNQETISRIENGVVTDPNSSTVEKLELALGVPRGTLRFESSIVDSVA